MSGCTRGNVRFHDFATVEHALLLLSRNIDQNVREKDFVSAPIAALPVFLPCYISQSLTMSDVTVGVFRKTDRSYRSGRRPTRGSGVSCLQPERNASAVSSSNSNRHREMKPGLFLLQGLFHPSPSGRLKTIGQIRRQISHSRRDTGVCSFIGPPSLLNVVRILDVIPHVCDPGLDQNINFLIVTPSTLILY